MAASGFSPVMEWNDFKKRHGRTYYGPEEQMRFQRFSQNLRLVNDHNQNQESPYKLAINHFSDWSEEELSRLKSTRNPLRASATWNNEYHSESTVVLPSSKDWRNEGCVTRVKNQGVYLNCWAFSATGSLEGQLKLKKGRLVSLSEQQLVDCSGLDSDGGTVEEEFKYIKENGICREDSYPYNGKIGACRYNADQEVTRVRRYIPLVGENVLLQAVANDGPVSVAIDATDEFLHYSSGIFIDDQCSPNPGDLNHAVLVVGYGSEGGLDFWIVKNSWGDDWGENGYIRMARNRGNQCGIATEGCLPVL